MKSIFRYHASSAARSYKPCENLVFLFLEPIREILSPRKFQRIRYHTEISAIVDPPLPSFPLPSPLPIGDFNPPSLLNSSCTHPSLGPSLFPAYVIIPPPKSSLDKLSCVAGSLECRTAYKFSDKYTCGQGVIACHCSWLGP